MSDDPYSYNECRGIIEAINKWLAALGLEQLSYFDCKTLRRNLAFQNQCWTLLVENGTFLKVTIRPKNGQLPVEVMCMIDGKAVRHEEHTLYLSNQISKELS